MLTLLQKTKTIKNLQLNNEEYALIFLRKTPFTDQKCGKLIPKLQSCLIKLSEHYERILDTEV